ncbi:hypothetical protein FHS20_004384 [Phyllobacterium endophyticum]|jgi:hypothetical protein|nr:hypothetical protein [Phyllobacterium endophyticum]
MYARAVGHIVAGQGQSEGGPLILQTSANEKSLQASVVPARGLFAWAVRLILWPR